MAYEWLLFDADGTLFDYDLAEASALQRTFAQAGYPFAPGYLQTYRRINARFWSEFERGRVTAEGIKSQRFVELFDSLQLEGDPLVFSRQYLVCLGEEAHLIDGAQAVLEALSGRLGLVLITNGLQSVQRSRLARSPIGHYFGDVIISEEVGASKPDGRIFDLAFEKMGHPAKSAVLIVGDSLSSDIRGGWAYGIDTCWYNPRRMPHDASVAATYEIHELTGVLPVVEQAASRAG
ncbi:MAG: YjjG family noncanonical pyrimidine nucleotidase [Anaerolineae bacterium]|jgi:YjjG family noncanonical pyrimidine nucleotidase